MTTHACGFSRVGLALVLAGLLAAGPLFAQSSAERPTLLKHLRTELNARDADRQERALVDVIALAACPDNCIISLQSRTNRAIRIENETGVGSVVDLDALAPDLLRVYRTTSPDGRKLLALSALINIGNQTALDRLVEEKENQGSTVRKATDMSLASFYLTKYPELAEQTMRRRVLSLDDVQRAEVLRLRHAKKSGGR